MPFLCAFLNSLTFALLFIPFISVVVGFFVGVITGAAGETDTGAT